MNSQNFGEDEGVECGKCSKGDEGGEGTKIQSGCGLDAVWMRAVSVIFDIFEPSAFQKYSTC